jgi:hypothetical protein
MTRTAADVSSPRSLQLVTASTMKLFSPSVIFLLLHYLFPTSSAFGLPFEHMPQSSGILPPKPRSLTVEVRVPIKGGQEVQPLDQYLQESSLLAEIR